MRRNLLILFSLFLGLTASEAQLLWKVTGKDLKHPSYLFGTHALVPIQYLDSVPGLFKAFNECNVVVGEMVLNNIDVSAKIKQASIMSDNTRIKDLLNADEYKLVDNELKAGLKLGLKDLSIMNPSVILTMYKMEIYKKLTGYSDIKQSDSYFQLVAVEKGKKVVGLETVDQQIAVLYGNGTLKRQADKLVETVMQKDKILNEMIHQTKLYKTGKIDELVEVSKGKQNATDLTELEYLKLVDNRNVEWLKKLPDYMKETSCFIPVGAIHLGGKNGLVKQLQKEGYKVKPVE